MALLPAGRSCQTPCGGCAGGAWLTDKCRCHKRTACRSTAVHKSLLQMSLSCLQCSLTHWQLHSFFPVHMPCRTAQPHPPRRCPAAASHAANPLQRAAAGMLLRVKVGAALVVLLLPPGAAPLHLVRSVQRGSRLFKCHLHQPQLYKQVCCNSAPVSWEAGRGRPPVQQRPADDHAESSCMGVYAVISQHSKAVRPVQQWAAPALAAPLARRFHASPPPAGCAAAVQAGAAEQQVQQVAEDRAV